MGVAHQNFKEIRRLLWIEEAEDYNLFSSAQDRNVNETKLAFQLAENQKIRVRIDENITRLLRLSRQIREHRKAKTDALAVAFDPKDDNQSSIAGEFVQHLEWRLGTKKYSLPDGFLKRRIIQTMMIRWRRMSFYSARASHTLKKLTMENQASRPVNETAHPSRPTPRIRSSAAVSDIKAEPVDDGLASLKGTRSHGLTLSASFKPQGLTRSIISSGGTKSLKGVQSSDFPKPPRVTLDSGGFLCPYCDCTQPPSLREQKSWQ